MNPVAFSRLVLGLVAFWGAWGLVRAEGIVAPDTAERDHPVPVTLESTIPDGAKLIGPGWQLSDGLNSYQVSGQLLVVAAKPGTYTIRYQIYWIHTEPVTLFDASGKEVTILAYLGSGSYDDTHTLTITGDPGPDPPDPGPDPQPAGPWQIYLMYDGDRLDNLPRDQRELLTSLALRQRLVSQGHVFGEVLEDDSFGGSVPSRYQPWIDAVRNDPMPRIAIAPVKGGEIRDYPLPANEAELLKLLEVPK